MTRNVAVLIPASGSSTRFKGKKKKQFCDIDGRAVFLRTIEAFADRDDVSQIVLAIPAEDEELFNIKWSAKLAFYGIKTVFGAQERYQTIENLMAEVKDDINLIALHDAVRPCVTQKQIDDVFNAAQQTGAAILANPLVGTIKKVDQNNHIIGTVDRRGLWEAQTPQVFKPDILRKAYAQRNQLNQTITDDAQLVEATGTPVKIVPSDPGNIKITNAVDLVIAEAILKARPKPKPSGPTGPWAAESMW